MKKGFTLVELVIVIVILGILSAVAIPKFVDLTANAKTAATKGALGGLRSGISIWYASNVATSSTTAWPAVTNLTATADADKPVMAQGVPANPMVAASLSTVITTTGGDYSGSASSTAAAWIYNTASGKIWASNDATF